MRWEWIYIYKVVKHFLLILLTINLDWCPIFKAKNSILPWHMSHWSHIWTTNFVIYLPLKYITYIFKKDWTMIGNLPEVLNFKCLFSNQCLGRFPGTIDQDPSVSKSNWLHVAKFQIFFINLEHILYIPWKRLVIFLKSWTLTAYSSSSTGLSVTSSWFSPFIVYYMQMVMWFGYIPCVKIRLC